MKNKIIRYADRKRQKGIKKIVSNVAGFFKKHKKTMVVLILSIAVISSIIAISNLFKKSMPPGITGIAKIDGYKFGVFETQEEAIEYILADMPAEIHKIEILNPLNQNVDVYTSIFTSLVNKSSDNEFLLDLTHAEINEPIVVTINIGGDGSLISKYLGEDVQTYYFAVSRRSEVNSETETN